MFSGIVEEVGSIIEIADSADGRRLRIQAPALAPQLKIGDSVSVSGCCLTAVAQENQWFSAEAVHETLNRTKLGSFEIGSRVNLELAMRLGDRLGGHLVSGHIDTIANVKRIVEEGFSKRLTFEMDERWAPFFIEKGSVAIDGVSLTVAGCDAMPNLHRETANASSNRFCFEVALIPHTLTVTTLGMLKTGDQVNIETDMIARYIARWFGADCDNSTLLEKFINIETNLAQGKTRARLAQTV